VTRRANAHARLTSACASNSRNRPMASSAIASNSTGALWLAFAKAQAVMARPCGSNSANLSTATSASRAKRAGAEWPAFA
jgi:hypothetical protein